jgi:hypothetical protein
MKLYDELAAYTGRPLELVRLRCQYAGYELAWLWNERKGNYEDFYCESDLYLYDLTEYQTRLHAAGWHEWLASLIQEHHIKSILDFGGGIGESTITAWNAGVRNIHFSEVAGSPQSIYAFQRFRHHGIEISRHNQLWIPDGRFDMIIAMDVLEHIDHPGSLIHQFSKMSNLLIANCDNLPFGILNPQHISHPNLEPFYEKVVGNLWRARR